MVLYNFIELNEYAVWVQGKRTANRPCGRLEQCVGWDNKLYPFALEVCVDRIQAIDPEGDVRDTNLIGLSHASPAGGRSGATVLVVKGALYIFLALHLLRLPEASDASAWR